MGSGDDDAWDAFGSDDDDDNENDGDNENDENCEDDHPSVKVGIRVASFLSQAFIKADPHIRLSQRITYVSSHETHVIEALRHREIVVVTDLDQDRIQLVDAVVSLSSPCDDDDDMTICRRLVVGGIFVSNGTSSSQNDPLSDPVIIEQVGEGGASLFYRIKLPTHLTHPSRCRWLVNHSLEAEKRYIQSASKYLSTYEMKEGKMTETSIQKAVYCLKEFGYCIIRGLLNPKQCTEWGTTVLESVHSAAKILLERDQVDIYQPHTSKFEPQAYRELSMREDLRFDIRDAPELSSRRGNEAHGNEIVVVNGKTKSLDAFLRGNESILDIIRRTMNPKFGDLFRGNLGRFNFGGSGTDGSFQDLRVSPVGGIVTLPGCGDQAIHADTPHLFENIPDLPAHYINVFAPGTEFNAKVGGTAFIHGSHDLEFTTKYCGSRDDYKATFPFLVRPALELGDVILFDCRILHFGMANDSDSGIERVLLYANTTMAWFTDPKNWDDRRRIFE